MKKVEFDVNIENKQALLELLRASLNIIAQNHAMMESNAEILSILRNTNRSDEFHSIFSSSDAEFARLLSNLVTKFCPDDEASQNVG